MMENERSTAINPREAVEEKVSLSDRFGLWLGFHKCSQDEYLAMVSGYVDHFGIDDQRRRAAARTRSNGRRRAARARAASPGSSFRISRGGWESVSRNGNGPPPMPMAGRFPSCARPQVPDR